MVDQKTQKEAGLGDGNEITSTAQPVASNQENLKRPYLITIAGMHVGELHKIARLRTTVGRGADADIRIVDDGISRHHVEIELNGARVVVRDLNSTNGTFHNGKKVSVAELADGDKISIGSTTILKFTYQDGLDEAFEQRLYASAIRDGLTDVLKREFFLERLEGEFSFAKRHASQMALIVWDLDHFKSVNDVHGHPVGDEVLAASSRAVARTIRQEDVFGRLGGEEFGLACRGLGMDAGVRMAERLRCVIEGLVVPIGAALLRLTASFGVATFPSRSITTPAELIAAADKAMYRAKAAGRNRVEAF